MNYCAYNDIMPNDHQENFFKELLKFGLLAIIIVLPIRIFIAQPFVVSGSSMEPTFDNGEYLIVDQLSYEIGDPERLDVVIFHFPKDESKFFIKRIIGLPGDTVIVGPDGTSITTATGEHIDIDESFIVNHGNGIGGRFTLGDDEYFVMGDNRPASSDSRIWGAVPRSDIVGRAFLRLLPPTRLDILPGRVN